jgi:predicted dehydrogenase
MAATLSWGIIGTGAIAHTFAKGVQNSRTGKLVAIGSRAMSTADKFGDEFKIPHRYDTYDKLLADKDVQAVYIATPHPSHAEWAIKAARAKKHILCEKPIGINQAEARAILEAAKQNDVFLMEGFMYRCHPQTRKLVELIQSNAIGEVKSIRAAFGYHWPKPYDGAARSVEHASAGGGILDVGCYPISLARLIAGAATGKPFAEPIDVKAFGHLGPERTDDYSEALLRFPEDIFAHCATATQLDQESIVRIYGADGSITIPDPWIPTREPGTVKMFLTRDGKSEEIKIASERGLYSIEADVVAENLERRQAPSPAMTWDDTLGNMRALDRWRAEIGLVYDMEVRT